MNKEILVQHVEALLFAEGRVSKNLLAKSLNATVAEVNEVLAQLKTPSRGIVAVDDGKEVELRTSPEVRDTIEEIRKEELSRELGRAGLEVLAAIMYRGPLSRAEVDFIRGVNSSQTLRTLLMRGLIRRIPNPKDERSYLYEPTTELLSHLGVVTLEDLPDYHMVKEKLEELERAYRAKEDPTNE